MARTSNFANVATVTRASTKTDAGGWDFTNGGTVGTLTEYASGVAAIHPTAGLLVEEGTTNEITNPRCEGSTNGVVGSGGVLPTSWSRAEAGTTTEVISSGTEDGWPYVDIRVSGSPPSGNAFVALLGSTTAAALAGETWTFSVCMKIVGGSLANMNGIQLGMIERTSGGGVSRSNTSSPVVIDSTRKRYFYTVTFSGSGPTAYAQPTLTFVRDGLGGNTDVTVRIYAPQMEEKAYPTSPKLPPVSSPGQSTRAPDDVVIASGAWSNDGGAGSFFLNVQPNALFNTARLFEYGPATNATRFNLNLGSSGALVAFYRNSSTDYVNSNIKTGVTVAEDLKIAIAADTNDFAASVSGATQFTDSSITLFTDAARVALGGWYTTGNGNCYIKEFRYWPKRLANAELEALVGN